MKEQEKDIKVEVPFTLSKWSHVSSQLHIQLERF